MEELVSFSDACNRLMDNQIFVNANRSEMKGNSKVKFIGKNNILCVEDGVSLNHSNIRFRGSNSVIYLSRSRHPYFLNIDIFNNSVIYIGANCYFNGPINMSASEQQNIVIGNECLFSFGIWIRTADPHLIYDNQTKRRINPSASVFIGDHVWIGQQVLILKGTWIGSGSIIGGAACVAGKKIPSNVIAVGNPARIIRENVFFISYCVHTWTDDIIETHIVQETDDHIYSPSENTVEIAGVDSALKMVQNVEERMNGVYRLVASNQDKNRFAVSLETKDRSFWKRIKQKMTGLK